MYFLAPAIIGILTPDALAAALAVQVLRIVVFAEPFFGASIVATGVFQGAGDSLLSSVLNFVSMWGVRVPLTVLLTKHLALPGAWIAMSLELAIRGILFLIVQAKKWWLPRSMREKAKQ